jgi:hypothetical protein
VLTRHFFLWQLSSSCPVVIVRHTKAHKSISSFYDPIIGWPKRVGRHGPQTRNKSTSFRLSFIFSHSPFFPFFKKEKGKQKSCLFGRFRQQKGTRWWPFREWTIMTGNSRRTAKKKIQKNWIE